MTHIHIVALDVPFPPDYGGVIDIYYKAKAFKQLGVKVILHCFEYGRGRYHDFAEIANEVHYYNRNTGLRAQLSTIPYIVKSRINKLLINRLLQDDYPIWMEGYHCSSLLSEPKLKNRKMFVRIHNIEYQYYEELYKAEKSLFKKLFFKIESLKLKKYESELKNADALFCITQQDQKYHQAINSNSYFLSVSFDFQEFVQSVECQDYVLFHGNLSVPENEKSVLWLLQIWKEHQLNIHFKIAGKNPSIAIQEAIKSVSNVELISNPNELEMNRLIYEAKVNLLISFQATGVKLKLLNALMKGNFCIANDEMLAHSGLEEYCLRANTGQEIINLLNQIESGEIDLNKEDRLNKLREDFNPLMNIQKVVNQIEMTYE